MNKNDIVKKIAEQHLIEDIVRNIAGDEDEDLKDLCQDLYIDLMNKDETLIQSLYETNQLRYFIVKMVINNIHSKNSPYYSKYKKRNKNKLPIEQVKDIDGKYSTDT